MTKVIKSARVNHEMSEDFQFGYTLGVLGTILMQIPIDMWSENLINSAHECVITPRELEEARADAARRDARTLCAP